MRDKDWSIGFQAYFYDAKDILLAKPMGAGDGLVITE